MAAYPPKRRHFDDIFRHHLCTWMVRFTGTSTFFLEPIMEIPVNFPGVLLLGIMELWRPKNAMAKWGMASHQPGMAFLGQVHVEVELQGAPWTKSLVAGKELFCKRAGSW